MVGSGKKRKSMDPAELSAHSRALKKERTGTKWYQEEAERYREQKKEKKKFFGLGGFLTKMRSSSKLATASTSRLPGMDSLHPEQQSDKENDSMSHTDISTTSTESVPYAVKRNAHLKKILCEAASGTGKAHSSKQPLSSMPPKHRQDTTSSTATTALRVDCTTSEGLETGSSDSLNSENFNSSCSEFSSFSRGLGSRGSVCSMPAPSTPREDISIRRSISSLCNPSSPLSHLKSSFSACRRSARLSKLPMESVKEEDNLEGLTPVSMDPKAGAGDSQKTPTVVVSGSDNGSEEYTTPSASVTCPTDSSFFTPDGTTLSGSRLKRCSASGSTLARFGGLLKKSFNSTSKGTPVLRELKGLTRRDTMDSTRMRAEIKRRRQSSGTSYRDVILMQSLAHGTPSGATLTLKMRDNRERERAQADRFARLVSISNLTAQEETKTNKYNTMVIDALVDGRPISQFSSYVFDYFGLKEQLKHRGFDPFARAEVIEMGEEFGNIVVAIGLVRDKSNLPMITRIGYDAAIAKVCEKKPDMQLNILIAPVFFPFETGYNDELAESMLRTVYRLMADNADRIDMVTIAPNDDFERGLIEKRLQLLLVEKRDQH